MASSVVANWGSLVLHEVNPTGKEIGRGAYGRVFEVNYEGKLYAAKETHGLLKHAGSDDLQKIKDGFLSKCHIWSTLRHPYIVPFLGIYYPTMDQYRLPVMVMEKMQQSLSNLIEKYDNIPLNVKLSILDKVCLGLRYLHSRNPPIVHGDLTPDHILLNNHLEAKITGLGVAKITGLDVVKVVKSDHNHKDFMPPDGLVCDPSLDVFSYGGVTLYVTTQLWPQPTDPTVFNPDAGRGEIVSEVKRRQKYLDMMTGDTADLKLLVISCLDTNPMNRPPIAQVSMTIKHVKDVKRNCDERSPIVWWSDVSNEHQESQESTVDVRIKAKETIRYHYEEKLSTKEVEINQLREAVTEQKLKNVDLITQNKRLQTQAKQLERRIKQLQKSLKEHQELVTESEQLKLENEQLKELSKNGLEYLAGKNEELKLENEQLRELSKESFDDATKTQNTTEHVARYCEETFLTSELEICQFNDVDMQNEVILQNKMLKRRIEQLRELSKKDMECQIKLENEINRLKVENEQLMKLSKESIDDVKFKAENTAEHVVRLKCDYEEKLSTKEVQINQLNHLVKKLEMSENELITGNANLRRTIEQLQESSKLSLEKLSTKEVEVNQLNDAVAELKREQDDVKSENNMLRRRFEQLEELSKKYREYQNKLETESKRLKLEIEQLRESSKASTDDVKIKTQAIAEHEARLKDYEEKLSTKEVEINQLNDTITELKIKQYDVTTENKILKKSNERLRELSKKDLENQNKLETESEKLKLEIEQLKESSKNDLKYLETEGEKLKLEIEQLRESLKKDLEYQNKLEAESEKLRLEIEQLRELSKSTKEDLPTTEEDSVLAHVIPIDGPYHINCDGQSGGCFVWDDCGLEINFPPQCSQQHIQVTMSTLLPVKNEIHPTVHIVSAVYQFNCNIKRFDKAFILRLQHCIELQSPEDCQKMRFIIQHGGNNDVKYGHFEVGSSYGTVNLHKFCRVFIVWICELWNNIRTIILPVTDDQDNKNNNSSQGLANNEQTSPSSGGHSEEHSPLQTNHTAPSQSANGKQHDSLASSSSSAAFDDMKREQHKESKPTSPVYKYESMIGLPRDHCRMSDWSSIYSIYVKLGGWRKASKESMQMEEIISNFPVNFYADEIEFDVGSVAMITCEKTSEEATIIVKCQPYQIKKKDVTKTFEDYVDTCKQYPLCCRRNNILRTIILKSFIHVTKTSDAPPSNCQLSIKGIKPHQQVDLCTSGCTNLTLVDTNDSGTKVNAGPVQSVSTSTTSTVQATTTLPSADAGKNQKRSFHIMYANIDISPHLRQSGILETKPEMKDLIINVIPLLKAEWEDVAFILNYKTASINSIKESHRNDPKKCCRELFMDWLETNHGVSPKTWGTLLNTIAESEDFTKTAEDILEKLEKKFIG